MVAVAICSTPPVSRAQQPAKVWRIGLLSTAAIDPASGARWTAFRDRLRDLGYVEGQN
jgi:hypothetical protein